ncbi:MAG: hypothetical protein DRO23_07095 [Thermoprotei archaeon]|nr:MAG: hypothetical protein DRO23_07095 [Thermoprotei archaeon]
MTKIVSSLREAILRLGSVILSFERIYGVKLSYSTGFVNFSRLRATENLLELEKLAVVLKKTVYEKYNIPIITIKTENMDYIIDGHHRAYVKYLLNYKGISAYRIEFSDYMSRASYDIRGLRTIETGEELPEEYTPWKAVVKLIEYYRKLYGGEVKLKKVRVSIDFLVPTQKYVEKNKLEKEYDVRHEKIAPIVCLEYEGKYYILDGHIRSLKAKLQGEKEIDVLVLIPKVPVTPGVVRTCIISGLRSLNDVEVIEA